MPMSSALPCAWEGAGPDASGKGLPEPELWQHQEPGHQNQNLGNKGNWRNGGMEAGGGETGQPKGTWTERRFSFGVSRK